MLFLLLKGLYMFDSTFAECTEPKCNLILVLSYPASGKNIASLSMLT